MVHQIQDDSVTEAIASLQRIRNFPGAPQEFWSCYLQTLSGLIDASLAILTVKSGETSSWRRLAISPKTGVANATVKSLNAALDELADHCVQDGYALKNGNPLSGRSSTGEYVVAVRLDMGQTTEIGVAAFFVNDGTGLAPSEATLRLCLIANTPAFYQLGRMMEKARKDVETFAAVIDLMLLINAEKRYLAMAMTFCNELASRFHCDRVSLGWLKDDYIRVQALSHVERFDRKMNAIKKLELAMEEALDQDEEIVWPSPNGGGSICRDHEHFSRDQGVSYLCSLPLRAGGKPVAVVMCERNTNPFSESDVQGLRVYCDQVVHPLDDRKRQDRWFGARWLASIQDGLARVVGPEHTWIKIAAVCCSILLAFLCFGKLTYRIEAPFVVHSEDVAFIPAPFDGYIDEVDIKIGDDVYKGDSILTLDTQDILLEKAVAAADQSRYLREAEKARAENALSDMRIAEALAEQARIRLELLNHRLDQAHIKVPFNGVLVEGDLTERIGSPVQQGEVLFKVAMLQNLYINLDVDEADVHEFRDQATGELAFASRPKLKYPIKALRMEPVSQAKEEGNIFVVRCDFESDVEDWWRPGMTGVAKLNVGKRNVLWIFTHKTIDFLRLFFWW